MIIKGVANLIYTNVLVDSATGLTPQTGKTLTITVSKDGGAFAASAGTVAELSNGSYTYLTTAGESTCQSGAIKVVCASCQEQIIPFYPFDTTQLPSVAQIAAGILVDSVTPSAVPHPIAVSGYDGSIVAGQHRNPYIG